MLLDTVIIILREVLEAALLVSVLLAISHWLSLKLRWLITGIITGTSGAFIYQYNLGTISSSFDYVGQEVANAALQIMTYACIAITVFLLNLKTSSRQLYWLAISMWASVSLAITREGSEIVIYISGFAEHKAYLWSATTGSMIGGSIGLSFGALMYYILRNGKKDAALITSQSLLALVAAATLSQASQLLVQADLLPSQHALWDSNGLLSEDSITGQLLYAIAGYEATPTTIHVCTYFFALGSILALCCYRKLVIGKTAQ